MLCHDNLNSAYYIHYLVSPLTIIGESENPSEFPPRREFPTVGRELGPIARGAGAEWRGPCSQGSGGGQVEETLEVL